jgi:hypothetical protein
MSKDYDEALEAAGATVYAFEQFGSYQGDWWAKVMYEGETGFVHGSYGSCSGCDSLLAEFDFEEHGCEGEKYYSCLYDGFRENCEICQTIKKRWIEFGKEYLSCGLYTKTEALKLASENLEWDAEAEKMIEWLQKQ